MEKRKLPSFSVIIPTFERPQMLSEAVASVLGQSFRDWELIIVDDASGTPLPKFDDPRISIVRNQSNLGKSASINRALTLSQGRFIAFLDDDDAWTEDRLLHAFQAHSKADVVVCLTGTLGEESNATAQQLRRMRGAASRRRRWNIPFGPMGADSVRSELCPLFDESFVACEDWDWGIRLWQRTQSVEIIPSQDYLWRRHGGARHKNGTDARIDGMYQLIAKHREFFKSHARARAERFYSLGLLYLKTGDKREAFKASLKSLRVYPTPRTVKVLLRSVW